MRFVLTPLDWEEWNLVYAGDQVSYDSQKAYGKAQCMLLLDIRFSSYMEYRESVIFKADVEHFWSREDD